MEIRSALKRAVKTTREGKPYLIEASKFTFAANRRDGEKRCRANNQTGPANHDREPRETDPAA